MFKKWVRILFALIIGIQFFIISCILEPEQIPVYYIAVISPRQDTTVYAGNSFYVQWRSSLKKFPSVTVTLHTTANNSITSIADNIKNTGLFYWKVPSVPGSTYFIKVTGIGDSTICGESAPFSILNNSDIYEPDDSISMATEIPTDGTIQTHTLSYPGDIDWFRFSTTAGMSYLIQSDGFMEKPVHLKGTDTHPLQPNTYNSLSSVIWTCTSAGMYNFSVSFQDTNRYTYRDSLSYTILVRRGKAILTLLKPQKGEADTAGKPLTLQWQSSSNVPYIVPKILRNDSIIASGDTLYNSNKPYEWYLPLGLPASSNYQAIIYSKTDSSIHSEPVTFSVVPHHYAITVTTPGNSDTMWTGDSTAIYWNCSGLPRVWKSALFKMDLCRDSKMVMGIYYNIYDTTGTYIWKIPYDLPASSHYQIRVYYANDTTAYGFSKEFTINYTPSTFKIHSPSPGTLLTNDSLFTIKWSKIGKPVSSFTIDLFDNTTRIMNIIKSMKGNMEKDSLVWIVPISIPSGIYRLKFTADDDSTISCWSSDFSITHVPTFFTITSPVANSLCSGSCKVSWQSTGPVGNRVNLSLWNDTAQELYGYRGYNLNTGEYDFVLPATTVQGERYRIKVSAYNDTAIQSFSDYFTIVPLPKTITVTAPTTKSCFIVGETVSISWTSSGVADGISTEKTFCVDLYDSIAYIKTLYKETGTPTSKLTWNIPFDVPGKSTYRIKITSLLFPEIFNFSPSFTINH